MQELVQLLKDKAGLTDEQAHKAILAMKEFLSGKVPPMFSGVVNKFFADAKKDGADDSFMP
ncbi:MAG: hypothetical protein IAE95_10010 [Chitinophagaceae bacterium]|jgi:hypothetical protein|nr:hypothetical protein [Chitinophagaceae bacterium]